MTAPLLSSEDRTACGHGAEAIGDAAYLFALRMFDRDVIALPEDGAWLTDRLAAYRRLCVLAGEEPKAYRVEQIEAAIALPEAKS